MKLLYARDRDVFYHINLVLFTALSNVAVLDLKAS